MKQTAIEWLESEMLKPNLSMKDILEQAKEIEKEQQDYNEQQVLELIQFLAEKEDFKDYSSISIFTAEDFLNKFKNK